MKPAPPVTRTVSMLPLDLIFQKLLSGRADRTISAAATLPNYAIDNIVDFVFHFAKKQLLME
jgi:hypothetical protein